MPLSEDEQRILSEIEQRLTESDPDLVREVGSTTLYSHARRNIWWAFVAFLAGAAGLVLLLGVHPLAAFMGFLVMLVAAVVIERNARKMGKAGISDMTRALRVGGLRDYLGSAGRRRRADDEPDET